MKKRTKRNIIEKAIGSNIQGKTEVFQDGVWLPVTFEAFEKIVEMLQATGCKSLNGKIVAGEWRIGIIPQTKKKTGECAIVITTRNPREVMNDL